MVGQILKKYWFHIAVAALVIAALAKKNHWLGFQESHGTTAETERFTEEEAPKVEKPIAAAKAKMGVLNSDSGSKKGSSYQMPALNESAKISFLKRFGHVAAGESKKFKVPASVLLATAYVNSFAGRRDCAAGGKNYFALPCEKDWNGATFMSGERCLRKYDTAWESFRDFSIFLAGQIWFAEARQIAGKDYAQWINIFANNGVSDVRNFEQEAMEVMEAYRLFELDEEAPEAPEAPLD